MKLTSIPTLLGLGLFAATAAALPAHASSHAPVVIDEISRYDCVRSCWYTHYSEAESFNQRQFCGSHMYDVRTRLQGRVVPCIMHTCDPRQKSEIVRESRVFWCNFCGWLPNDAGMRC
jgi:hypothetical protein